MSFGSLDAGAAILYYPPERTDMLGVGLVMGLATLLSGLTGEAIGIGVDLQSIRLRPIKGWLPVILE